MPIKLDELFPAPESSHPVLFLSSIYSWPTCLQLLLKHWNSTKVFIPSPICVFLLNTLCCHFLHPISNQHISYDGNTNAGLMHKKTIPSGTLYTRGSVCVCCGDIIEEGLDSVIQWGCFPIMQAILHVLSEAANVWGQWRLEFAIHGLDLGFVRANINNLPERSSSSSTTSIHTVPGCVRSMWVCVWVWVCVSERKKGTKINRSSELVDSKCCKEE